MKNNPTVSVILTSYNHERFLRNAIDSVLGQTFADFQLIIADDASTDGSWDIATSYRDKRIALYRNKTNQRGIINTVLHSGLVRGRFVAIHHSDDEWEPNKLAEQVSFLAQHPKIAAVFTRAHIINSEGDIVTENQAGNPTLAFYLNIFHQHNLSRHEWLRQFANYGNRLCHPSVLIRKTVYEDVGPYDVRFRQLPDLHYWIRLCLKHDIHVLPQKLTLMRVHTDGSNSSAATPANRVRDSLERFWMMEPYRSLASVTQVLQVFPEAAAHLGAQKSDPLYLLARALLISPHRGVQLYGCQLLFEGLQLENRRALWAEHHGFTLTDFHNLIVVHDVFGATQEQMHADLRAGKESVAQSLRSREKELAQVTKDLSLARSQIARQQRELGKSNKTLNSLLSFWQSLYQRVLNRRSRDARLAKQIETIRKSGLFDEDFYVLRYSDVADSGMDPIAHYVLHGWKEHRDPSPLFNTRDYLMRHPQLDNPDSPLNPFVHYIQNELRKANQ